MKKNHYMELQDEYDITIENNEYKFIKQCSFNVYTYVTDYKDISENFRIR